MKINVEVSLKDIFGMSAARQGQAWVLTDASAEGFYSPFDALHALGFLCGWKVSDKVLENGGLRHVS
jgi:hypothetical protein